MAGGDVRPRHDHTRERRRPCLPKKKIAALVKVQLQAGSATPAPPVGTALGPHGVNIMDFCKAYNAQTESMRGNVIPVEITIYEDRSFDFITKTPPAAELIKKAAGLLQGLGRPAQGEGRQADQGPGPRDRDHQAARPQRQRHRRRHEDRRGHRPLDGRHDRLITWESRAGSLTTSFAPQKREDNAAQQDLPRGGRGVRPGRALRPAGRHQDRQVRLQEEVRRDPRRRHAPGCRPAQGRPDGPRHRQPAPRHRQDRPRPRVRQRRQGRRRPRGRRRVRRWRRADREGRRRLARLRRRRRDPRHDGQGRSPRSRPRPALASCRTRRPAR